MAKAKKACFVLRAEPIKNMPMPSAAPYFCRYAFTGEARCCDDANYEVWRPWDVAAIGGGKGKEIAVEERDEHLAIRSEIPLGGHNLALAHAFSCTMLH